MTSEPAPLPLTDREVHLWWVFSDPVTDPALLQDYRSLMSAEEHEQQQRFVFARDRHQYLVTRALVRTVLSRYAPVRPEEWTFMRTGQGKPEVAGPGGTPPLRFNLSHCAGLVACAVVLGREVGVDVEDIERRLEPAEIAHHFFSPAEVASLRALPADGQREVFFDYWTLKEAYIKARGEGLAIPLQEFTIQRGPAPRIAFSPEIHDDPTTWQLAQLRPSARHKLALAVRRSGPDLDIVARETVPLVS